MSLYSLDWPARCTQFIETNGVATTPDFRASQTELRKATVVQWWGPFCDGQKLVWWLCSRNSTIKEVR